MRVRLAVLLTLAAYVALLLPATAPAGKVVDTAGHRVGWASWAKVLDKKGAMVGYLVKAGRAEYCVNTYPTGRLIAAIESRKTPVKLWVGVRHRNDRTWRGKATACAEDWALYERVAGRWVRKGTAYGGRGATAVAALRLLLWD
jgi:hypothetical protein